MMCTSPDWDMVTVMAMATATAIVMDTVTDIQKEKTDTVIIRKILTAEALRR